MNDLSDTSEYLNINCSDLNLYFAHTHVKVLTPDMQRPEWAFIDQFDLEDGGDPDGPPEDSSDCDVFVRLTAPSLEKKMKYSLEDVKFDFGLPQTGLYNYKKVVVLLSRRSFRQNKKAVCNGTISFFNTFELFRQFAPIPEKFLMQNAWSWTIRNVNNVLSFNAYCSLEEAFKKVSKLKDFSRALNPNFFVGQGIDKHIPSLWYRKTLIGDVLGTKSILIRNQSFLQEAQDFFLPEGVTVNANV